MKFYLLPKAFLSVFPFRLGKCSYLIQFLQFSPNGFSYLPSWSLLDTSVTLKWDSATGEPHWPGVWIVCVRDSLPRPPPPPPFPSLFQEGWTLEETPTGALTPPLTHTYTHWLPNLSCLWLHMLQTVHLLQFSVFFIFLLFCLFIFLPTAWIHFNSFFLLFLPT